jgi:hypothetical protein
MKPQLSESAARECCAGKRCNCDMASHSTESMCCLIVNISNTRLRSNDSISSWSNMTVRRASDHRLTVCSCQLGCSSEPLLNGALSPPSKRCPPLRTLQPRLPPHSDHPSCGEDIPLPSSPVSHPSSHLHLRLSRDKHHTHQVHR